MTTSRRRFLHDALGGSALLSFGLTAPAFLGNSANALAARGTAAGQRILVVVQLSGGNDGLNTVVPYRDPLYARNRIALRISENAVLKLADGVGLHPQLAALATLWEEQQLAVVQGVGYPNPNRSHFESMDIWHSCQRDTSGPRTGWLGRMLDRTRPEGDPPSGEAQQGAAALHLGRGELPLALVARRTAVPSIDSLDAFRLRATGGALAGPELREVAAAATDDDRGSLAQFVQQSTLTALDASHKLQESLAGGSATAGYPGFGLASKLQTVAQLIDADLPCRIYYVSLGGFDTHASQASAHSSLLNELSQSLAAFLADLQARGHQDRVMVMTFSEFGRRVKENASGGTDHGAAAPMFLLGSQVNAGLIGPHPSLSELDSGDLKHHTDFRQVYAALLEDWLDCPSAEVLGGRFTPAKVIAKS